MNGVMYISLLLQALLAGSSLLLGSWGKLPVFAFVALGLLNFILLTVQWVPVNRRERAWKWSLAVAWLCSVAIPAIVWIARDNLYLADTYYAGLAWLGAGVIFLGGRRIEEASMRTRWKLLGTCWALVG